MRTGATPLETRGWLEGLAYRLRSRAWRGGRLPTPCGMPTVVALGPLWGSRRQVVCRRREDGSPSWASSICRPGCPAPRTPARSVAWPVLSVTPPLSGRACPPLARHARGADYGKIHIERYDAAYRIDGLTLTEGGDLFHLRQKHIPGACCPSSGVVCTPSRL